MIALPANIEIVEETGSTNADLAALLRAELQCGEGRWLIARRQNAGRGRQGRTWFDGAGNFMGSVLVQHHDDDPPPASLSFVAALAVRDAAAEALGGHHHLALKWPNDVLLDGRKLSGILLEMVRGHVIVGIGVNLLQKPDLSDRQTAAIADYATPPPLENFAIGLAAQFARRVAQWRSAGLPAILNEFLAGAVHSQGSAITVHDGENTLVTGSFAGLDETDGALRLRLANGTERVIRAGDLI